MKNKITAKSRCFLLMILLLSLCSITFAQSDEKQEIAETEKLAKSFFNSYVENNFNLEKIPQDYFVEDFRKTGTVSIFFEEFDKDLSNEEKFQNYTRMLELMTLLFLSNLEEANFDLDKAFSNEDLYSKKFAQALLKYPKAKVFLGENPPKIQNADDVRTLYKDLQSLLEETKNSLSSETKSKFLTFLENNEEKFFKYDYSSECSEEDCRGLPEETEIHYYRTFVFDLVITKINDQWKIVSILPVTD